MQQINPAMPSEGGLRNREWRYTPASHTDIRARFERMRAEQTDLGRLSRPAPLRIAESTVR